MAAAHSALILATSALLLGLSLARATLAPAFEQEPVLGASSFVRPALLSGPGYQVDPHVEIRGYMARFTIDTAIGSIQAESVEILGERIAELPALEALEALSHSQVFVDAADASVTKTAHGLGRILRHPVQTLTGIPIGVARYFGNRLKRIGKQAQALSDRGAREFGSSGNPHPRGDGPMTEAREIDRAEALGAGRVAMPAGTPMSANERTRIKRQQFGQFAVNSPSASAFIPTRANLTSRDLDKLAWAIRRALRGTSPGRDGGVGGLTLSYSKHQRCGVETRSGSVREHNAKAHASL